MSRKKKNQTPGFNLQENKTHFCFYCPEAKEVECEIFEDYHENDGHSHTMEPDKDGYWHLTVHKNLEGFWYGYRVDHPKKLQETTPHKKKIFADPYSRHVTVKNNYRQEAKSYIFQDNFDWEDDRHCFPEDLRDLVIYETHLKDLTAHESSGANGESDYQKFIDLNQKGGLAHLKKLGINCVQFLPLQKFANIEPPYGRRTKEGFLNSWNPYSYNYWGYMTSFFFAPESVYASGNNKEINGHNTNAVTEFKQLVKTLHSHGITVLMDVVYNHTSLFDLNPLTHLCPHTYLRTNDKGELLNRSGTGNEYRSENPQARQLIIDSLRYWIEEFHIDGFRFDLAALLDRKTWDGIKNELTKIDPRVVLIAEPWGGHYAPQAFSDHGWASWNDRIRNSIKGSDPLHDRGYIFSDWQYETSRERLENLFRGTLRDQEGGLYHTSQHSVNYLESHDGYTLGDFIRIGLKPELSDSVIKDRNKVVELNDRELRLNKFAALSLFCAQGTVMIHAGQELARAKIVAGNPEDVDSGKLDHNSYQKDDETNWINFDELKVNKQLFNYYRGLINIRKSSPALCKAGSNAVRFDHYDNPLILCFIINGNEVEDNYDYYVILNGARAYSATVDLPPGQWELLANSEIATDQTIDIIRGSVTVPEISGMLFRQLRH